MSIAFEIFNSVVKIIVVGCAPNYAAPWQMLDQHHSTSSGFIIGGRQILTNAHAVTYAKSIRICKHGDSAKYNATILHIGHECDLALLTVENEKFWTGTFPLEFGDVPLLQETVVVIGYPAGGDNICVTKGVVSRVGFAVYSHALENLLAIQIDAAINPGNSGGPTISSDNKVTGVAFEGMTNLENVGFIIPVPIILHFLEDIYKNGKYTGFPHLCISYQTIENDAMKRLYGLKGTDYEEQGVLISKLFPLTDVYDKLKVGDVLVRIDDIPIGNDGTIVYRKGERIVFEYLIILKFINDKTTLTILRDSKVKNIEVTLSSLPSLVPVHLYDKNFVDYFIYAGFVFIPLTYPYLISKYGASWSKFSPVKLCDLALNGIKHDIDEEVVILNNVLVSDQNIGYHEYGDCVVSKCNNTKIKNLKHLMSILDDCKEEFVKIEIGQFTTCILDNKLCKADLKNILTFNNIPFDRSINLLNKDNIILEEEKEIENFYQLNLIPQSITGIPSPGIAGDDEYITDNENSRPIFDDALIPE